MLCVLAYLLSAVPEEKHVGSHKVSLTVRTGVIASRLNISQEHFSRILHELAARKLLDIDGRTVTIPDLEWLRSYEA